VEREAIMRDSDVRRDVETALERDSGLDAGAIAVAVDDGVATLRGDVNTQFEKQEAERVALRIYGVEAVANDLVVRPPEPIEPNDTELAQAIVDALTWNALVPLHRVKVVVSSGWVTLSGTLEWEYQRTSAERTVRGVGGVKGVSNLIRLQEPVPPNEVRTRCA
jgi:osmotically-inducible protein OsmY